MLKIKDNLDLKELEKFGFSRCELYSGYTYGYTNRELHLVVRDVSREITIQDPFREIDGDENNIEMLFDLIQAGLVEKVEG